MITRRLVDALDDRLAISSFASRNLRKVFPDHWAFMLGECALWCFVMLVLTGIFLTFWFVPSSQEVRYTGSYAPLRGQEVSAAYDSVLRISFDIRAGLVMRQIHHWAALVFMACIVAHLLRVFFTGAFRRPRDVNWLVGVALLLLGMGAGFTGYSLPDDLLSGTGLRIAYSVVLSIPFVGEWLAFLFFGGEFPNPQVIPRLYPLHIFLIPAAIATALTIHLAVVWHQTHTQFRAPGRSDDTVTGSPLYPNYGMKALGLMFGVWSVLAMLGGLFQINPVWLYGPYLPYTASSPAQPDWYVGWLEGIVRLWPNWEFTVFGHTIGELFLPGIVFPGVFFGILLLWPYLEAAVTKDRLHHHFLDRPRDAPARSAVGAAGLALMAVLTLAGGNDVLATFLNIEVDTLNVFLKVAVFAAPVLAGAVTFWVCRDLRRRDLHPIRRPDRGTLVRTAGGGFERTDDGDPGTGGRD